MSTSIRTLSAQDAPAIARIPEIAHSGFMPMAARRLLNGRAGGCRSCRSARMTPAGVAQLIGPTLARMASSSPGTLYRALHRVYLIRGPVQLNIGACNVLLQEPKDG